MQRRVLPLVVRIIAVAEGDVIDYSKDILVGA